MSTRKDRAILTVFSLLVAVPGHGLGSTSAPFQIASTIFGQNVSVNVFGKNKERLLGILHTSSNLWAGGR